MAWGGGGIPQAHRHAYQHTSHAGGVAIVLHTTLGHKWGTISAHVPHHATTAHTEMLMAQWGEVVAVALRQRRVLVGMDANEQFTPSPHTGNQQARAHTSRAEAILAWHQRMGLRLPPQDLAKPSHFPYATMLRPRRLDYVFLKGCFSLEGGVQSVRDIARSDHEAVTLQLRAKPPPNRAQPTTCGPRHVSIRGTSDLQTVL